MADSSAKSWDFDSYDWLPTYDERMRAKARLCYEETLRQLPDRAGAKAGDRVLDIGVGTGNSSIPFLERGCHVVGIDPSEKMLEQARAKAERWGGRFILQHADDPFLHLPFEDAAFDVVASAYAIHHLDEPAKRQAVTEMTRVLRAGGRIAIADTMFLDAAHKARALAENRDMEDEFQPLLTAFPALFEAAGFRTTLHPIGEMIWILVAEKG